MYVECIFFTWCSFNPLSFENSWIISSLTTNLLDLVPIESGKKKRLQAAINQLNATENNDNVLHHLKFDEIWNFSKKLGFLVFFCKKMIPKCQSQLQNYTPNYCHLNHIKWFIDVFCVKHPLLTKIGLTIYFFKAFLLFQLKLWLKRSLDQYLHVICN